MDITLFTDIVKKDLYVFIAVSILFGKFIKDNINRYYQWTIPFILILFNLVVSAIYILSTDNFTNIYKLILDSMTQSIGITAFAVFSNQIYKQSFIKRNEE